MEKEKQIQEISAKLDRFLRLLAVSVTFGKSQNEQIRLLDNAGFQPKEIADIIGTTANTVRVGKAAMKKKKSKV